MNTQKVAITVPRDLIDIIDKASEQRRMSRSRFISLLLRERLLEESNRQLREQYDKVFADSAIRDEQLQTALWLDGAGSGEGQEW